MTSLSSVLLGPPPARDYSVAGPAAGDARAAGLVDGEWFVPPVDPDRLRELSRPEMRRPLIDLALYVVALVATASAAIWVAERHGPGWSIPLFVLYAGLYGGAVDARWHEFGHGTATPSRRLNGAVYAVSSFQAVRNPVHWQWSHFRHHSDTIVVGRDPEIQIGRPGTVRRWLSKYLGVGQTVPSLWLLGKFAAGRFDTDVADYVPAGERPAVVRHARAALVVHLLPFVAAAIVGSWYPVLLVGIVPSTLGVWLMVFFGVTQHLGLAEDVLDHRANTRTVLMNPVFRFLYLNMNFHVEHHIFPTVPYYRLPALHREIAGSLPPPTTSTWRAYREIFHSFRAQRSDPGHVVEQRPIPEIESLSATVSAVGWARPDGSDDLGPIDRFAVGSVQRVDVADRTYAVARVSATEFCALDGVCTHGNAHLGAGDLVDDPAGPQVRCPKHLGRFDARTGAPCSKPVRDAVASHPTTVVRDHLIVTPHAPPRQEGP